MDGVVGSREGWETPDGVEFMLFVRVRSDSQRAGWDDLATVTWLSQNSESDDEIREECRSAGR